jgi:hypothetical protein
MKKKEVIKQIKSTNQKISAYRIKKEWKEKPSSQTKRISGWR